MDRVLWLYLLYSCYRKERFVLGNATKICEKTYVALQETICEVYKSLLKNQNCINSLNMTSELIQVPKTTIRDIIHKERETHSLKRERMSDKSTFNKLRSQYHCFV